MYILNNNVELIKLSKKEFKKYSKVIRKIKHKYSEVNSFYVKKILFEILHYYKYELYNVDCIILNRDLSFEILYQDNNYNIMFHDIINLIIEEIFTNNLIVDYIKVENSYTTFDKICIWISNAMKKKNVVNNLNDYIKYFRDGERNICFNLYDLISDKVYDLYLFGCFVLFIFKCIILYLRVKIKHCINFSLNFVKI